MNYHRNISFSLLTVCLTGLLLAGCGRKKAKAPVTTRHPFTIVTTVGMIGDVVTTLVGTNATVNNLIPAGKDPHLYQPVASDQRACEDADLIFYNGHHLEGNMIRLFDAMRKKGKRVVAVAESLPRDKLLADEENPDAIDPHIWMDVGLWIQAVEVVAKTLADFDSPRRKQYETNAANLINRLLPLETYAKERMATIPEQSRVLITAHDAFRYLGRTTGLEVRGVQGLSTQSEAGMKDIRELITLIVEKKIPAIFSETSVPSDNVQSLLEGAASKGHRIVLGGKLFSDAMGPSGTYEGTYMGMIDHNITTIVRALGGNAPEKGMHGVLNAAGSPDE